MRIPGTHVPGVLASQPSPSHTPDAQSVPARQLPPSGTPPTVLLVASPAGGGVVGTGGVEGSVVGGGSAVIGDCLGADEHAHTINAKAMAGKRMRGRYHRYHQVSLSSAMPTTSSRSCTCPFFVRSRPENLPTTWRSR